MWERRGNAKLTRLEVKQGLATHCFEEGSWMYPRLPLSCQQSSPSTIGVQAATQEQDKALSTRCGAPSACNVHRPRVKLNWNFSGVSRLIIYKLPLIASRQRRKAMLVFMISFVFIILDHEIFRNLVGKWARKALPTTAPGASLGLVTLPIIPGNGSDGPSMLGRYHHKVIERSCATSRGAGRCA